MTLEREAQIFRKEQSKAQKTINHIDCVILSRSHFTCLASLSLGHFEPDGSGRLKLKPSVSIDEDDLYYYQEDLHNTWFGIERFDMGIHLKVKVIVPTIT